MNYLGLGDLATSVSARRQNLAIRTELNRLTAELSSGQKADISKEVRGHIAPIASIERSLLLNEAFSELANGAALKLDIAETSLSSISTRLNGLGASILGAVNAGSSQVSAVISGASDNLETAISALSVQVSGKYIFSGMADTTVPLADAQELLEELEVVTSGATTATEFKDRVEAWFGDPSGFGALGYLGSEPAPSSVKISSTEKFAFEVTPMSDEVRNVLESFALVALIDRGSFSGSEDERLELARFTAEKVLAADTKFIALQAELGESQQGVARAQVQNASENFSLISSRDKLLGVDIFDVATKLESVQLQLESFYLITAKTSRLNLTEFLR